MPVQHTRAQSRHPVRVTSAQLLPALWLVGLAVVQLAGVVAVYLLAVTTATGQYLEAVSLEGAHRLFSYVDPFTHTVIDATFVASLVVVSAVVVVLILKRRQWRLAAAVGVGIIGANVTTRLLKSVVLDRPRIPGVLPGAIPSNAANTLPSGHITITLSLAVALVLAVSPRRRDLAAAVGTAYVALVGVVTLSAQWHRPADVVAACLVVGAWKAAVGAVAIVYRGSRYRHGARDPAGTVLGAVAIAGVGCGVLVMLALMWAHPSAASAAGMYAGYAGGVAVIVGMCAAVVAGVLTVIGRLGRTSPE